MLLKYGLTERRRRHVLAAADLIKDEYTCIHFVYSRLYGDSRDNFGYTVEKTEEDVAVRAAGYIVPDVKFRRE